MVGVVLHQSSKMDYIQILLFLINLECEMYTNQAKDSHTRN